MPLFTQTIDQYAAPWQPGKVLSEQEFEFRALAKQRHGGTGRTKQKTRNYERMIFECARDGRAMIQPADAFGLRVLFLAQKRRGDLSNLLKAIEDALNRLAYHDDSMIDYLQVIRKNDQPQNLSLLQVIEPCTQG